MIYTPKDTHPAIHIENSKSKSIPVRYISLAPTHTYASHIKNKPKPKRQTQDLYLSSQSNTSHVRRLIFLTLLLKSPSLGWPSSPAHPPTRRPENRNRNRNPSIHDPIRSNNLLCKESLLGQKKKPRHDKNRHTKERINHVQRRTGKERKKEKCQKDPVCEKVNIKISMACYLCKRQRATRYL